MTESDRSASPFEHREDITGVWRLTDRPRGSNARTVEHTTGALVTFRATPGQTAEYLQRVIDCQLARHRAPGGGARQDRTDPLGLPGIQAEVYSVGNGFAVAIRAEDPQTAREVMRRANRLGTTHPAGR